MDDHSATPNNRDDTANTFILQLVFQSIENIISPLRLYNEESELIPVSNFSIALFEDADEKQNRPSQNKITGYKLQFNSCSSVSPGSNRQNVIAIESEEQVGVEPFSFIQYKIETKKLSNLKLKIKICIDSYEQPFFSTFIGTQFVHDYESPNKSIVGIVLDSASSMVGEIKPEYTILKPWSRHAEFENKFNKYSITADPCNRPIMVGHRGSGVTYCETPSDYMENSIHSFIAAYECGADFVELDIQLTRDNNIVVYHDNDACMVLPTTKPLSAVKKSKKRLKKNSIDQSVEYKGGSAAGIEISYDEYYDKHDFGEFSSDCQQQDNDGDSCSTADSVSSLNVSIRHLRMDQLRSHKFVNSKSDLVNYFKQGSSTEPGMRDEAQQHFSSDPKGSLFPTLSEVLKELPLGLGVNIEIKSPQESKNGQWENDYAQNYDRNKLIDLTLDVIFNKKQPSRRIIFSSFDPWICSMLRYKQHRYPVLLLVEAKIDSIVQSTDIRLSSVDGAILFAAGEKLDGVVSCIDPILKKIESVVKTASQFNLAFFTYGECNNNLENILLQSRANVDGIISDRLKDLLPQLNGRVKSHQT